MSEEEFLRKINFIFKNNQIAELKRKNEEKDSKIKKLSEKSKKMFIEFGSKNKEKLDSLNEKIKVLEEENIYLKQERNYYKEVFDKIPSFIRRIFVKEKKTITE